MSLSCILLVYIEYLSDQQQYEYQEEKWRRKRLGLNLEFPFRNIFNIQQFIQTGVPEIDGTVKTT